MFGYYLHSVLGFRIHLRLLSPPWLELTALRNFPCNNHILKFQIYSGYLVTSLDMDTLSRLSGIFENKVYLYLEGKPEWIFFLSVKKQHIIAYCIFLDRNLTHLIPCYWINCFRNLGAIPPLSNRARRGGGVISPLLQAAVSSGPKQLHRGWYTTKYMIYRVKNNDRTMSIHQTLESSVRGSKFEACCPIPVTSLWIIAKYRNPERSTD
jgi:hypothetical protein